ncbi:energy-coupling factor transporter transmembrane component T [Aeromonas sp. RU39B]|uniref:energy-coupling factor transporter transmembrane component T n=1 Tax=Aeromonas sp. RU39B TaxID=1907416 RepID=UPI001C4D5B5B|nr:energy-coupling factor transporter transmembrane component T [Aeromonas sp. RU39B]
MLTIWLVGGISTLLIPLNYLLVAVSFSLYGLLFFCKRTRARAKYVTWIMLPMAAGLWLVHSGWLAHWLTGQPVDGNAMPGVVALWLRLLAVMSGGQIMLLAMPTRRFIRALFASRLPISFAYLMAGPLLIAEQLRQQLAAIHEAQLARGVPLDEGWYQRLRYIPALITPLVMNEINELSVRGAALDMRAFRLHRHRVTLWAPPDPIWQQRGRYCLLIVGLIELGVWLIW